MTNILEFFTSFQNHFINKLNFCTNQEVECNFLIALITSYKNFTNKYTSHSICSFINKKCQKMLSDYRNYYHFYQKYLFNQFSQQLSLYYYSCLALPTCSINSSFVHFHKKKLLTTYVIFGVTSLRKK